MRLVWKWLIVSIGGGLLITVLLLIFDPLNFPGPDVPSAIERIAAVVFWPVSVCVYLSGPGAPIGEHRYEATPVQYFAAMIGIGLSWSFWSSFVFFILRLRRRGKNVGQAGVTG